MTQITTVNFSQKWDQMISYEAEEKHRTSAFYNNLAMIATAVSSVALTIIASVCFPEMTTVFLICIVFLMTPAIELGKKFKMGALAAKKLEDQAQKVRSYYASFVAQKETNPEIKALSVHWKKKADEALLHYKTAHQKAVEKSKESQLPFTSLQRFRWDAMEAEKTAATMKVYSLFLESLINKPLLFQKAFVKYGEDFSSALSGFSTWDTRDVERRTSDLQFGTSDPLLTFHNASIPFISYTEVFQDRWKEQIKHRLCNALIQKMAH